MLKPLTKKKINLLLEVLRVSLKENNTDVNRKNWVNYIIDNEIKLTDLLPLIHAERQVSMRFSWLIGELCEQKPEVVSPCVVYFFSNRNKIQIINFDRSLAKMFWLCGIPKKIEGIVVDELFKWLLNPKITVSTKSYSLFALTNFATAHPEIKNELRLVVEDQLKKNSISFEKKAIKVLRNLCSGS